MEDDDEEKLGADTGADIGEVCCATEPCGIPKGLIADVVVVVVDDVVEVVAPVAVESSLSVPPKSCDDAAAVGDEFVVVPV